MVSVSLRQKPASATDQNAPALASIAVAAAASVRPVSGTPLWARNDHAPGTPRPASPWDEWFIPPKPTALTELTETRKPSPHPTGPAAHASTGKHAQLGEHAKGGRHAAPTEPARHGRHAERTEPAEHPRAVAVAAVPASGAPAEPSPPFRPWRIDFTRPDVIEYPAIPEHSITESPGSVPVAKRLLLLLGLAYLFIAALTSGLAYTGYLTTPDNTNRSITSRNSTNHNSANRNSAHQTTGDTSENGNASGTDDNAEPAEGALPPRPPAPRPPSRHPNAPGLHTRPDGSRYLIMPLPADLADRFRGHTDTIGTAHAAQAAVTIGGGVL